MPVAILAGGTILGMVGPVPPLVSMALVNAFLSAAEPIRAMWRIPISAGEAHFLSAPDVVPRLLYVIAFALAAAVSWQLLRLRDMGVI